MPVRRVLGVLATLAIGILPVVPPEHVHEVEEHGHIELVVHRHLQGHGITAAHEQSAVDHDDAPIVTLDQAYVVPPSPQLDTTAEVAPLILAATPLPWRPPFPAFVERVIHGPPRGPTLDRGPPSLLAS